MRDLDSEATWQDVVAAAMSAIKCDCFGAEILDDPEKACEVERVVTVAVRIAFTHHMDYVSPFEVLGPLALCPGYGEWVEDVRLALRQAEFLEQFDLELSLERLLGVFDTVEFMMYVVHKEIRDGMVTTDPTGKPVIWDRAGNFSRWPKA